MDIIKALEWRYATKKFDSEAIISDEKIEILKNAFNLTASSYGLQPVKLLIVNNKSIQNELDSILGDHSRELLHSYHWKQAIPQSHVGFGQWKKELFEKLPRGMHLAGNYLGKVGVADVFSSGYDLKL